MKVSELKRLMKKNGCYQVKPDFTGHERWYSPTTCRYFAVPRHNAKEIATGTMKMILAEAGIQ